MRTLILVLSMAAVFSTAAIGLDDCRCFTPSAEQVAAVEARMEVQSMPLGKLDRYARYYAGVIDRTTNRRFIRGKLVPLGGADMVGSHVVVGKMPPLQGEGCISMFDAGGGSGMYFRCARQGAWTPSDAQIAELEEVLRQNAGQRPGYARHYAGVTEGGRRIIRGVLVDAKMLRQGPGVYVESEVELPAIDDGGCWVVHVTYDPSNREMTWRCGYTA